MLENIWSKFIRVKRIYGKKKKLIVDRNGEIINNSPTDEALKGLHEYLTSTREILKLPEEEKREYLLEFLRYFHEKEGRVPEIRDFINNPKYPSMSTIVRTFGSWDNAIRESGLLDKRERRQYLRYTDDELLVCLVQFYEENRRPPTTRDFMNNPKYPHYRTYEDRFGSWENALKLIGLDIDSMIIRGVCQTRRQRARLAEILVKYHFDKKDKVIDLSGENHTSPYDGICPSGKPYDVKSCGSTHCWKFRFENIQKEDIEWYYLLAFSEDFSELLYTWRIPAWDFTEDIEKGYIQIYKGQTYRMKQYEITEKIMPVFKNWLNNIQKKDSDEKILYDNKLYDIHYN